MDSSPPPHFVHATQFRQQKHKNVTLSPWQYEVSVDALAISRSFPSTVTYTRLETTMLNYKRASLASTQMATKCVLIPIRLHERRCYDV
jgi:hypothetical protein